MKFLFGMPEYPLNMRQVILTRKSNSASNGIRAGSTNSHGDLTSDSISAMG
jgi:hypothetical protein